MYKKLGKILKLWRKEKVVFRIIFSYGLRGYIVVSQLFFFLNKVLSHMPFLKVVSQRGALTVYNTTCFVLISII